MNIAIINQNGGKYLFEVPESITLKEGEKVKCDTRRGVTDGTCKKMENTPCQGCFDSEYSGFDWVGLEEEHNEV